MNQTGQGRSQAPATADDSGCEISHLKQQIDCGTEHVEKIAIIFFF
jgi:hypothetical protein